MQMSAYVPAYSSIHLPINPPHLPTRKKFNAHSKENRRQAGSMKQLRQFSPEKKWTHNHRETAT